MTDLFLVLPAPPPKKIHLYIAEWGEVLGCIASRTHHHASQLSPWREPNTYFEKPTTHPDESPTLTLTIPTLTSREPNTYPDGSPTLTPTGDQRHTNFYRSRTLTLTVNTHYPWLEPSTHSDNNTNTHPDGNNSSSSSTTVKWRVNSRPFWFAWRLHEDK